MKAKRIVSLGLAAVTALGLLGVTGCGKEETSGGDTFSWWIVKTDGNGLYEDYDDNPSVQWLNQQTWDVENGTIAEDDAGNPPDDGTVYIYRYEEDETGAPSLENILDDEECALVEERFDELLDESAFDEMD